MGKKPKKKQQPKGWGKKHKGRKVEGRKTSILKPKGGWV